MLGDLVGFRSPDVMPKKILSCCNIFHCPPVFLLSLVNEVQPKRKQGLSFPLSKVLVSFVCCVSPHGVLCNACMRRRDRSQQATYKMSYYTHKQILKLFIDKNASFLFFHQNLL
jgi:hypothetical protein